jgi:hypothetical protein
MLPMIAFTDERANACPYSSANEADKKPLE